MYMIPHIHLWTKQQLKLYIQTNFHCSMLSICFMKSQKQVGAKNCGLFAIVSAPSLAFGEDASTREYCQAKMCMHIYSNAL